MKNKYTRKNEENDELAFFFAKMLLNRTRGAKKILDIGCGSGDLLCAFKSLGLQVKGVDISSKAIKIAGEKVDQVNVYACDVAKERLPFKGKFFDIVTAVEVVEHLSCETNFFKEAFRVLKPGGLFFMTTPNHGSVFGYMFRNFVKDDPTHTNLHREKYWIQKTKEAGFSIRMVRGITLFGFPPLESLRQILRTFKLPLRVTPVFSPIRQFCSTILIFATRN